MGKKARAGQAWKTGYSSYKAADKYGKNRERDLRQHLEDFPNDEVAKAALKNIRYRRAKPKAKGGWVTGKVMFGMMEYVGMDHNPCAPADVKKSLGFNGARARKTQVKLAQYIKLSRKTANEMMHLPKDERPGVKPKGKKSQKEKGR